MFGATLEDSLATRQAALYLNLFKFKIKNIIKLIRIRIFVAFFYLIMLI